MAQVMTGFGRVARAVLRLQAGLVLALATALSPAFGAGADKATGQLPKKASKDYDYYLTGPAADRLPPAPASAMRVLMGGGEDVDAAFAAMIAHAGGQAGAGIDIVVIRTSGADGYNPYLAAMPGVDSVETLVIKTRAGAADPVVNDIVSRADVLLIAGGDQSTYVALWDGTPLEATLQALLARRVPMAGTSAGLAVMGDVDYTGENGSVTSERALANPYDRRVTLSTTFLTGVAGLEGAITDAHLAARDRMGRLVVFLARMLGDGLSPLGTARAIGIDEATALVVDGDAATVVGAGAAYFLRPATAPTTLAPRTPLTMPGVQVHRLRAGQGSFDLGTWQGAQAVHYQVEAWNGVLTSDQAGGSPY